MEEVMHRRNLPRILITVSLLSLIIFTTGPTLAVQNKAGVTTPMLQEKTTTKMKDGATVESPFVCNVAGLNAEQRQRYTALIKKLNSGKQEVKELADGYAFRFSAESTTVQDLAEFITYERLCCPFFDFELAVEREGGPAWLRLKGREGVKEFIRIEFKVQ
jgi:hypothetical protein